MAASADRNTRKSIDKSPSRLAENKNEKLKESVEEKTKEKDKKAEDFSERPDKREKSPVKKSDGSVRSDGKAEAKVSPMRSNTSQASPSKQQQQQQQQTQPDPNRRSVDQQYSPMGGTGSPNRGPGHWVQGMVSPPKPVSGVRDHSVSGSMKSAVHNSYEARPGPMVMSSPSPDLQMMSHANYQRYPPIPAASPEVQVVEVQRTGYYQGYPPPRQQYSGYDRHQPLGPGYHQGLPPPAHYYPGSRGQQGSYGQPPGQYHQSYGNQQSSGQGGSHSGQNGLYPLSPPQHSSYSSSTHHQQSRTQPLQLTNTGSNHPTSTLSISLLMPMVLFTACNNDTAPRPECHRDLFPLATSNRTNSRQRIHHISRHQCTPSRTHKCHPDSNSNNNSNKCLQDKALTEVSHNHSNSNNPRVIAGVVVVVVAINSLEVVAPQVVMAVVVAAAAVVTAAALVTVVLEVRREAVPVVVRQGLVLVFRTIVVRPLSTTLISVLAPVVVVTLPTVVDREVMAHP